LRVARRKGDREEERDKDAARDPRRGDRESTNARGRGWRECFGREIYFLVARGGARRGQGGELVVEVDVVGCGFHTIGACMFFLNKKI